jgi:hypothetical protein
LRDRGKGVGGEGIGVEGGEEELMRRKCDIEGIEDRGRGRVGGYRIR